MSDAIGPRALDSRNNEGGKIMDKADEEVDRILTEQYERGINILTENREVLDQIAKILIEKEKISGAELVDIIREVKPELVSEEVSEALKSSFGKEEFQDA